MKRKTKTKKKRVSSAPRKKSIEPIEDTPTIPSHKLEDFVGYVKNLHKIDCKWVFNEGMLGDRYRVNVYTETPVEGAYYDKMSIDRSFSLRYDGDQIIDKTITKQEKE